MTFVAAVPRTASASRASAPRVVAAPPGALECSGVIARPPLPPGPFLVVGLARSGVAAALALRARGAEVLGCDSAAVGDDVRGELTSAGVEIRAPSDGVDLLARAATVVKSPGVPHEAPVIATAHRRGLPVVGELEIGWRMMPNEFVA